jgi:hypothetical protein
MTAADFCQGFVHKIRIYQAGWNDKSPVFSGRFSQLIIPYDYLTGGLGKQSTSRTRHDPVDPTSL